MAVEGRSSPVHRPRLPRRPAGVPPVGVTAQARDDLGEERVARVVRGDEDTVGAVDLFVEGHRTDEVEEEIGGLDMPKVVLDVVAEVLEEKIRCDSLSWS